MPALIGGLLIGVGLGLLGSGGSILTVPILAYGLGHADRVAIAESLLIVGAIALVGSLPYIFHRRISWRNVFAFGIPGMAGTWLGAAAATFFTGAVQLLVFGVVMLAAAVFMLRNGSASQDAKPQRSHSLALVAVEGIAVGAVTGFVGVGGGFLIVPALVLLRGLRIHYAIGTSLLIIAMKSTVGFWKYQEILRIEELAVHWPTIGIFVLLGAVGAVIGTQIGHRLDPRLLRRTFATFLVVMSLFIVFRETRSIVSAAGSAETAPTTVFEERL